MGEAAGQSQPTHCQISGVMAGAAGARAEPKSRPEISGLPVPLTIEDLLELPRSAVVRAGRRGR